MTLIHPSQKVLIVQKCLKISLNLIIIYLKYKK
jgi:hypothetical protein